MSGLNDLDPNCLTLIIFLKPCFENFNFEKKNQQNTEIFLKNHPACKGLIHVNLGELVTQLTLCIPETPKWVFWH